MLWWSPYVFLVLCPLISPGTVNGGYLESGADMNESRIVALIERLDRQEGRMQSLEIMVAKHTKALAEKDKKIEELEQEITDVKSRFVPIQKMFHTHAKYNGEPQGVESKTYRKTQGKLVLGETGQDTDDHNNSRHDIPAQSEIISIADRLNEPDVQDNKVHFEGLNAYNVSKSRNTQRSGHAGSRHTSTVKQRKKRVDSSLTDGFAFSVSLSSNTNVVPQGIIKYDDVMIDTGNGYNHGNGIYEVPASGVYVFTWSIRSGANNGLSMITQLMINGVVKSTTDADSDAHNWESATGIIVTSVTKGDHVYIRGYNAGQVISQDLNKSTFSCWRLF
ncbi:uncharacterized protein LOC117314940 [Pecten maximus]|uniref:uncharacterized protein LOC117314940 n=1 Tax=Pecten maximus TaxID=6579 RepID=UPI001459180A|nr:uncharacterized protein LOC117314940 [Pecten maximus]